MSGTALDGLDPTLSAPKRLAIMAVLASSAAAEFTFLREHLGVTDSDLSKQASALEAAGYLAIVKQGRGRGGSTRFTITREGRKAYHRHRDALTRLLGA